MESLFNRISVDEMEQVLNDYHDPRVRQLACFELARRVRRRRVLQNVDQEKDPQEKLIELLKSIAINPKEDIAARHIAIRSLGNHNWPQLIDSLVDIALYNTDPTLRAQACLSLGSHVYSQVALDCLLAITANRSEEIIVQQYAYAGFRRNIIGGKHTNIEKYVSPLLEVLRNDCATIKLSVIDILLGIAHSRMMSSSAKENLMQAMMGECSENESEGINFFGDRIKIKDHFVKAQKYLRIQGYE